VVHTADSQSACLRPPHLPPHPPIRFDFCPFLFRSLMLRTSHRMSRVRYDFRQFDSKYTWPPHHESSKQAIVMTRTSRSWCGVGVVWVWCVEMEVTGTFKHRKVELVNEGFDVNSLTDPIYIRDDTAKTYHPLTPATYSQLQTGALRL
jgi:hypothetical protein